MSLSLNELASGHLRPLSLFNSVAQAERYVDGVAARLGLATRTDSHWRDSRSRALVYQNSDDNLELSVAIAFRGLIEGRPSWATKCIVRRLDARLRVEMPFRLRPAAFEKDARELLGRLRSLRVEQDGRIFGHLAIWKKDRGYGYLECLPGIFVYAAAPDMESVSVDTLRCGRRFTFQIRWSNKGQQATNLKPCNPP